MRAFGALGLCAALAAGLVAAPARTAHAQRTAAEPAAGLRPALEAENPSDPRPWRMRTTRQGQGAGAPPPPAYGNPPGSGAGSTGYRSTNPPPRGARAGARPMGLRGTTSPAAQGNGTAAVSRPGSPNPGASRPGASIDVPAGTATPLIRRRRPPEDDPFAPTGIRAGSFILRPSFETTAGHDSNAARTTGGRGSGFLTIAPELQVRSDWRRHALNADIRGSYSWYDKTPEIDRPYLDARINGRLDITRQTRADIEGRLLLSTDNPGSPDLPAGLARLPIYTTVGTTAGLTHQFNRFELTLKGSIDRTTYQNSLLTDGSSVSNGDRNYNQYAAQLRAAYELTPGMKPFIEGVFDTRVRDIPVDAFGVRRDSDGATVRVGTTFEFSQKLTGEVSVGYLDRRYKDPTLPELKGLIADASLVWTATALTTVKLTAKSSADESTLTGVSGVLRRDFGAQIDHAFRRWLIGTARIGYGLDTYEGSTREDKRMVAAVAVTYKINRDLHLKGEVRREWLRSNVPGFDYTADIALIGLRLQR